MTVLTKYQIKGMLENMKRYTVWGNGHDQCMMHANVTEDQINFL